MNKKKKHKGRLEYISEIQNICSPSHSFENLVHGIKNYIAEFKPVKHFTKDELEMYISIQINGYYEKKEHYYNKIINKFTFLKKRNKEAAEFSKMLEEIKTTPKLDNKTESIKNQKRVNLVIYKFAMCICLLKDINEENLEIKELFNLLPNLLPLYKMFTNNPETIDLIFRIIEKYQQEHEVEIIKNNKFCFPLMDKFIDEDYSMKHNTEYLYNKFGKLYTKSAIHKRVTEHFRKLD